jgi:hypothetical protein
LKNEAFNRFGRMGLKASPGLAAALPLLSTLITSFRSLWPILAAKAVPEKTLLPTGRM